MVRGELGWEGEFAGRLGALSLRAALDLVVGPSERAPILAVGRRALGMPMLSPDPGVKPSMLVMSMAWDTQSQIDARRGNPAFRRDRVATDMSARPAQVKWEIRRM